MGMMFGMSPGLVIFSVLVVFCYRDGVGARFEERVYDLFDCGNVP